MAVVAAIDCRDVPAQSTRLLGEGREERPRRIVFRNAGDECGLKGSLSIGWKMDGFLKAAQTEMTQPRTHEIAGFAGLESPEIELALATGKPPAIAMVARDAAKVVAGCGRKQVEHGLSIFGNECIHENQSLNLSGV